MALRVSLDRLRYAVRVRQWVRSGVDDLKLAVVKPLPYAAADKMPLQVPAEPRRGA